MARVGDVFSTQDWGSGLDGVFLIPFFDFSRICDFVNTVREAIAWEKDNKAAPKVVCRYYQDLRNELTKSGTSRIGFQNFILWRGKMYPWEIRLKVNVFLQRLARQVELPLDDSVAFSDPMK